MPTENGYSNQKKKGQSQFKTINQVGSNQFGNPISQKTLFDKTVAAIAITAVTDILGVDGQVEFWQITLPTHTASKNDVMRMITGTLLAWEYDIIQVIDANNFYILPISDTKPIVAETAKVLGWTTSKSSQEGELVVVVAPSPVAFVLDGVDTEVEQDTAVAANNRPLPSQLFIYKDGVQIPITKDTGTPANTVGVPVEIVAASGTPINITAGDINVQLTDLGVNFDAVRLGDGSGNYVAVNAANEALVHDADVLAQAVLLVAKDFATSAKQDTLLAELQLKADLTETQPVSLASIPLATGAATEAKQDTQITAAGSTNTKLDTIIAKDFATETTLAAMSAKLPATIGQKAMAASLAVVIASDQSALPVTGTFFQATQPISAASLPLPTGASTEAKQDAEIILIGGLTETAPATDTASSGLNGRLQRIAQRLTSLIALFPTSLGTKTAANSLAVTLSSDQAAIPDAIIAGTITNAQITVGTTAVRATVAGTAPNAARKRLSIKPSKNNTGAIYYGSSAVTTANGLEIIGPDRLDFTFDASDYYLRSDTAAQVVEIVEVV